VLHTPNVQNKLKIALDTDKASQFRSGTANKKLLKESTAMNTYVFALLDGTRGRKRSICQT
jgi:hypothetical protein